MGQRARAVGPPARGHPGPALVLLPSKRSSWLSPGHGADEAGSIASSAHSELQPDVARLLAAGLATRPTRLPSRLLPLYGIGQPACLPACLPSRACPAAASSQHAATTCPSSQAPTLRFPRPPCSSLAAPSRHKPAASKGRASQCLPAAPVNHKALIYGAAQPMGAASPAPSGHSCSAQGTAAAALSTWNQSMPRRPGDDKSSAVLSVLSQMGMPSSAGTCSPGLIHSPRDVAASRYTTARRCGTSMAAPEKRRKVCINRVSLTVP